MLGKIGNISSSLSISQGHDDHVATFFKLLHFSAGLCGIWVLHKASVYTINVEKNDTDKSKIVQCVLLAEDTGFRVDIDWVQESP